MPVTKIPAHSVELIAPAGDMTGLLTALKAGADAVYFGAEGYNMRAGSSNFTPADFPAIKALCQEYHAKGYLALNTIVYDGELKRMKQTVTAAKKAGFDAIICSDMAVIEACRNADMAFHISTQASVSSYSAVKFYASLGAKMIVLARELTIEQVCHITDKIKDDGLGVKIECFVHGAMCVAVSGRCFMSQDIFGRSANRGQCVQPCRREYIITDPEENKELALGTDYVMSPQDLCTIEFIDVLIDAGISAFKIEGRSRSPEYVHTATAAYRTAIDFCINRRNDPQFREEYSELTTKLKEDLATVYNRGFSKGFYFGKPLDAWVQEYGSLAKEKKTFIGDIKKYYPKAGVAEIIILARGLKQGEKLSIQGPKTGVVILMADSFLTNDLPDNDAHKGDNVTLKCAKVRKNDKVYLLEKRR
ncbi:U32 family peptidase [Chlorobium sp. BLA1]|uniref:peptidase U32 family protein n=1 Tax=Candidatus Chlorobium masyuteum TaxID=2716876 RepID=UPI001424A511|nr:peptidase U32 family protein [Candidatus Chlorobium masyuteum]NHQ59328.1 U32 family peptidase [Candidatus Chlorobium masyuteum]